MSRTPATDGISDEIDARSELFAEVSPQARTEAEALAEALTWVRSRPAERWNRVHRNLEHYAATLARIEDDERARLARLLEDSAGTPLDTLRRRLAHGLDAPGLLAADPRLRAALLDGLAERLEVLVPDWREALGRATRAPVGRDSAPAGLLEPPPSTHHDWHRRLEADLERHLGCAVQVRGSWRLPHGVCNLVFAVDALVDDAPRRLCMRADGPGSQLFGFLPKSVERDLIALMRARGVPCATPLAVVPSPVGDGEALISEWFDGEAKGHEILCAAACEAARPALARALARALAAAHQIAAREHPALLPANSSFLHGDGSIVAALRLLAPRDAGACPGFLALEQHAVHSWLVARRPAETERCLIHGDFRLGNLMVAPDGRMIVLDWETSHWGDRHRDIAHAALPHFRFGQPTRTFAGLCDLDTFLALYHEAGGQVVDWARLHWWRVYLCLWMAAPTSDWDFVEQNDFRGAWEVPLGLEAMSLHEALRLIDDFERGQPGAR